jgi:gmma-aminobutyric acid receptor subunit gamma/cGMP-dependent protein kinase 2
MVKYADDTTVCGLIKNDETSYRNEVQSIVNWCTENDLELNVNKTQEFVIDFRKNPAAIAPLVINGSEK